MNSASVPVFAVIYARVSTDAQALTPSIAVQEAQARACAESLSATVAAVHRDEGLSGALYHARPGLQEALASPDAIAAAIDQARSEMGQAIAPSGDAGRLAAMERQERAAMQAEVAAIADGRDPEPYRRLLREIASKRAAMGQGAGASVAPALARLASMSVPALCALLARAMERIESDETTDETRSRVLSSVVRSVTPDEKGEAMLTELQPLTAGATVERITIRSTVGGRLERVQVVWDEQGEGGER